MRAFYVRVSRHPFRAPPGRLPGGSLAHRLSLERAYGVASEGPRVRQQPLEESALRLAWGPEKDPVVAGGLHREHAPPAPVVFPRVELELQG